MRSHYGRLTLSEDVLAFQRCLAVEQPADGVVAVFLVAKKDHGSWTVVVFVLRLSSFAEVCLNVGEDFAVANDDWYVLAVRQTIRNCIWTIFEKLIDQKWDQKIYFPEIISYVIKNKNNM